METLAPLVARLGCAVLMVATFPFARAFADPASIDVAGIKLGSTIDEAQTALKAVGEVAISERTGYVAMNDYTMDHLHFGSVTKVGHEITPEQIELLYDLRPPQSVIGIWRAQPFQKAKAPLVSYIRNAFIEKYGTPLYDGDVNRTTHTMLWNFGGQLSFSGQAAPPFRYGDCTRLLPAGQRLSNGGYQLGIEPIARKCGTWIEVFFDNFDDNRDLVRVINISVVDLVKTRGSFDYVSDELKKGLADKHKTDNGAASNNKPKL